MPRKKSDPSSSTKKVRSSSQPPGKRKVTRPRTKQSATSKEVLSENVIVGSEKHQIPHEEFRDHIARRAYELFEQRGSQHGQDVDHWIQAEKELKEGP